MTNTKGTHMTKRHSNTDSPGAAAPATPPAEVSAAADPQAQRAARQSQLTLESELDNALRFGKPLAVEARHAEGLLSVAGALPLVPEPARGHLASRWERLVKDILRPAEPRRGVSTVLAARCGALWADVGRAADPV